MSNRACRIRDVHHVIAVSLCFTLFVASPASAHHSFDAEYNANRPVTLTGRVAKLLWQNPHSILYVDVLDAKTSRTTSWSIELGSINTLVSRGLIVRVPDPMDARRVFVQLAPETSIALRQYFAEVADELPI